MTSLSTQRFYEDKITSISPLRAIAESVFNEKRSGRTIHRPTLSELYSHASKCPGVTVTDLLVDQATGASLGLPEGARVLNHNHGGLVGRNARIRHFMSREKGEARKALLALAMEGAYSMSESSIFISEVCCGLDSGLMIRARMATTAENTINLYNWCLNFTPMELIREKYENSIHHDIPDILVVSDPGWKDPQGRKENSEGIILIDYEHNTILLLGQRYFGEHKKGTLTLAWSSGMRLGRVACHGGIKEVDFSAVPGKGGLGRRTISFFGLSGSGKSSHTNSSDNGGTLPRGHVTTIAHDDAFQIDYVGRECTVWEPTLFDKTDSRCPSHPDWKHVLTTQNQLVMELDGKVVPVGLDIRNNNGRAIFSRSILGRHTDKTGFPDFINWLMKDSTLPPVVRISDGDLAVAMGATLMTKRSAAENVPEEEMKRLVFEPFANPFRVYELFRDCEGFGKLFESGAVFHVFNSGGFWKDSDASISPIPLKLSHRLQTAILLDEIEWVPWEALPGALIPSADSIEKIWPGYSKVFDPKPMMESPGYRETLRDRMAQREDFLEANLADAPEIREKLVDSLRRCRSAIILS